MRKILVVISIFALTSTPNLYSQVLGFFTMKEGLQVAIDSATVWGMNNPQLVNALTVNQDVYIDMVEQYFPIEFIYEGANIGKANAWIYTFVEKDNLDFVKQVGILRVVPMGNMFVGFQEYIDFGQVVEMDFTNPIDLEQLIDSDEFVKKLVQTSTHSDMQSNCFDPSACFSVVGVGAVANSYLCLQPNEINWLRIVETNFESFCCKTPYNDASLISCGNEIENPDLEFFTMKEGLDAAIEKALLEIPNPQLIWAGFVPGEFKDVPGVGSFVSEIIYEGEDIGKANMWAYIFVMEGNIDVTSQMIVMKIDEQMITESVSIPIYNEFSYLNPIYLEQLVDSDEFLKSLVENPIYSEMENYCSDNFCVNRIAVGSVKNLQQTYCLQPGEINWISIVQNYNAVFYCCKTPFNDASQLSCEDYVGIVEVEIEFPISIFPTPATNTITVNNPENILFNSITIYDILGNKIADFDTNTVEINISNFVSGNYFICFTVGNKKIYRSLVKK